MVAQAQRISPPPASATQSQPHRSPPSHERIDTAAKNAPSNRLPNQVWIRATITQYRATHGTEPSEEVLQRLWESLLHSPPPPPQELNKPPSKLEQRIIDHEAKKGRNPDAKKLAELVQQYLKTHPNHCDPRSKPLRPCRSEVSLDSADSGTPKKAVKAEAPGVWY